MPRLRPDVALAIFTSDRFADHLTPPGHPERVERAEVMQVVASEFRRRGGRTIEPRPAVDGDLVRIHGREYLGLLRETAGRAVALDPDTFTSPDTYDTALLAAGAVLAGINHVLDTGQVARALAMVRPPGHHAERDRAMGFCLLNNVAVGAAHARAQGLARVAVVDYDVHHGNGTQWAFYDDPAVLYISSHQSPFYPGTGAVEEIGSGPGAGFTANFPLEAGATDTDYERVWAAAAGLLRQFSPELILLSAGFDAHMDDPIGGMRLTAPQFGRLTALVGAVADECCQGRLVAVTEGGYDLPALAASLRSVIGVLDGSITLDDLPAPGGDARRGLASLDALRPHLAKYWTL
ncbi:MAG: histone deacetylase [Acidobacteria bacterium]|nr:histone deacetylase [Acidobacteriota bacterium]